MTTLLPTVLHHYLLTTTWPWLTLWLMIGYIVCFWVLALWGRPMKVGLIIVAYLGLFYWGYYSKIKGPKGELTPTCQTIQAALERPERAMAVEHLLLGLPYWEQDDDTVCLRLLGQLEGEAAISTTVPREATLPMALVAQLEQAFPKPTNPEASDSANARLQQAILTSLAAPYFEHYNQIWWISCICAVLYLAWLVYSLWPLTNWSLLSLYIIGLGVMGVGGMATIAQLQYRAAVDRQALVCEPIAAAVLKAFTNRTEVTVIETGKALTLKTIVPRPFLGQAGELNLVVTLSGEVVRKLNTLGASYGYPAIGKPEPVQQ